MSTKRLAIGLLYIVFSRSVLYIAVTGLAYELAKTWAKADEKIELCILEA